MPALPVLCIMYEQDQPLLSETVVPHALEKCVCMYTCTCTYTSLAGSKTPSQVPNVKARPLLVELDCE